jgi:hypothetical protein
MLDRATLVAAAVTLAAAVPVHQLICALPIPASFLVEGVATVREAAPATPPASEARAAASAAGSPVAPAAVAAAPLELASSLARVAGRLHTPDGTPVPGEAVELASWALDTRYFATSDARGRFSIPNVAPGSDYEVRVSSDGRYRPHTRRGVAVAPDGLELDLVLAPLAGARLAGRMVDADGAPIPMRTLLLQGSHQPGQALSITGDEGGRFRVDAAPTGRLSFTTRSVPHLKVSGPLLTPGTEADLVLVLDEGSHELGGWVVGDHGLPVKGAQLKLSWSHKQGDSVSSSARTAVTDAEGGFRFTGLGPGPHQLAVRAEGYEELRETYGVFWNSGDVELRLRPTLAR